MNVFGKENKPPKTNSKNENDPPTKRSSVPRVEQRPKLASIKQFKVAKKAQAKKSSVTKLNNKSIGNLGEATSNSSILGFSQSRSRLHTKRMLNKQYHTSTDEEKKVAKELEALHYLVLNCKFFADIDNNGLHRK